MTTVLAVSAALLGGVWIDQWSWCALALGMVALLYWLGCGRRHSAPQGWTVNLAAAFAAWMTLQLVPLPLGLVEWLSPTRAQAATHRR